MIYCIAHINNSIPVAPLHSHSIGWKWSYYLFVTTLGSVEGGLLFLAPCSIIKYFCLCRQSIFNSKALKTISIKFTHDGRIWPADSTLPTLGWKSQGFHVVLTINPVLKVTWIFTKFKLSWEGCRSLRRMWRGHF